MSQSGNPLVNNTSESDAFANMIRAVLGWEQDEARVNESFPLEQNDISSSLMAELMDQSQKRGLQYKNQLDLLLEEGSDDEVEERDEAEKRKIRNDQIQQNKSGDRYFASKNYEKAISEYYNCITLQRLVKAPPKLTANSLKKIASCHSALAKKNNVQYAEYMLLSEAQPGHRDAYLSLADKQMTSFRQNSDMEIKVLHDSIRCNVMHLTYLAEHEKHLRADDTMEESDVVEALEYDATERREALINMIEAHFDLANIYNVKEKVEKAIAYVKEGLEIYRTVSDLTTADRQRIQDGNDMIRNWGKRVSQSAPQAAAAQQVEDEKNKENIPQSLIYHVLQTANAEPILKNPPHSPPKDLNTHNMTQKGSQCSPLLKNSWFNNVGPFEGFSLDATPEKPKAEKSSLASSNSASDCSM